MIEKVNPSHPDKVADRIAGAIVDLAYSKNDNCKIAVEVLIGHGVCHVICETSEDILTKEVERIVDRIADVDMELDLVVVKQDEHLAKNQSQEVRCGDNGIFKGVPLTREEKEISRISREIYNKWNYDGKYILTKDKFIVCQSNAEEDELREYIKTAQNIELIINPLGYWTGGTDVDTGATNRKLGSDMAQSVTGGGLHGKDLSKADVSVNIYAFRKAQETGKVVELNCAIGDDTIDGKPYSEIVKEAREYINSIGGFEKFAEWGLF
jgi:S-adenosylmethionine synthetase